MARPWHRRAMTTANNRCLGCAVREKAVCGGIAGSELDALSEIGRRRTLAAGQVLTWAGDANLLCASVVSGILKVAASTSNGREQIVGLLFGGDFVGQPFSEESTMTVTALTQSDLCIYPRERFERVLGEAPSLERALLKRTMRSLNDARERMLSLGKRSAQERVAGFLLDLSARAEGNSTGEGMQVDVPVSRGDLADYLGLTIETVSRQLTRLKARDAIRLDRASRAVRVMDPTMLMALANRD